MTEARISHEDLQALAQSLAEARDEELSAAKEYPNSERYWVGVASGLRLALTFMHLHSDGAYGQTLEQQRSTKDIRTPEGQN